MAMAAQLWLLGLLEFALAECGVVSADSAGAAADACPGPAVAVAGGGEGEEELDESSALLQLQGRHATACCLAYTAECLACAAGMTVEEYCTQNPGEADCLVQPCALCNSCGGDFPVRGGRTTYYRDEYTEWWSYGEECSGQLRERTGDGRVIFSPDICCMGSPSLLETKTKTEALATAAESESAQSRPSVCALCDECGNDFPHAGGRLPVLWNVAQNGNAQNYERYEGACTDFYSTASAPPGGQLCCKGGQLSALLEENRSLVVAEQGQRVSAEVRSSSSVCVLCGGSCGGSYTFDGGYFPYAKQSGSGGDFISVEFTGFAEECGGNFKTWVANSLSFNPKLCCKP